MEKCKLCVEGIDGGTIARTALLVLALTNQILASQGKSMLPIDNEELNSFITLGFTIAASVAAWWKNNSLTNHAQKADAYLQELKDGSVKGAK